MTDQGEAQPPKRVSLHVNGQVHEVVLEPEETIFAGALRSGVVLPFSCVAGYCGECMAQLEEGEVELKVNMALTPKQRARGEVLTCQAIPSTQHCRVRFPD
jgi:ferredoxin